MASTPGFEFGRNWQEFLRCVDERRKKIAEDSVRDFLGVPDLRGRTFLDIGCGSGLFSLAAHRLGAERIVSMDVDPFSVKCCRHLHAEAGSPSRWEVHEGSVLDPSFLRQWKPFDVVYSWGVLHHTGRMWDAIRNAAAMTTPGGDFHITIYNRVRGPFGSRTWTRIKRAYVAAPGPGKRLMEWAYMGYYFQSKLLRFKNPFRLIRDYPARRGMAWRTNIIDWIGGYPYEYASVPEIFDFVRALDGGFVLANLHTTRGLGTNWFLFRRDGTAAPPDTRDAAVIETVPAPAVEVRR